MLEKFAFYIYSYSYIIVYIMRDSGTPQELNIIFWSNIYIFAIKPCLSDYQI